MLMFNFLPCRHCQSWTARAGWVYSTLVMPGPNRIVTRFTPKIKPEDYKFDVIPNWPKGLPILFLHSDCQIGTGCIAGSKNCMAMRCVPYKPGQPRFWRASYKAFVK